MIQSLEGVELVSVVGIPFPATFSLTVAVIKKSEGFDELSERDVIDCVASKLPDYKQLHGGVFFIDEFPLTPSKKIIKRDVTKLAAELYRDKQMIS